MNRASPRPSLGAALVQEGFYPNRSDLVRTALHNGLALDANAVKQTVARGTPAVGLQPYRHAKLEKVVAAGALLQGQPVGLAHIAEDGTPEMARAAIETVSVLGAFQASPAGCRAPAVHTGQFRTSASTARHQTPLSRPRLPASTSTPSGPRSSAHSSLPGSTPLQGRCATWPTPSTAHWCRRPVA
jgi:hypothetical protein